VLEREENLTSAPYAGYNAAEICEAIANAAKIAGTLISLRNWSTESIAIVPQIQRFQKGRSIPPLNGLTIVGQKLIGKSRPSNREQRKNRNKRKYFHRPNRRYDCGQKRLRLAHFQDVPEKHHDPYALRRARIGWVNMLK
jgi:hypothetical protein